MAKEPFKYRKQTIISPLMSRRDKQVMSGRKNYSEIKTHPSQNCNNSLTVVILNVSDTEGIMNVIDKVALNNLTPTNTQNINYLLQNPNSTNIQRNRSAKPKRRYPSVNRDIKTKITLKDSNKPKEGKPNNAKTLRLKDIFKKIKEDRTLNITKGKFNLNMIKTKISKQKVKESNNMPMDKKFKFRHHLSNRIIQEKKSKKLYQNPLVLELDKEIITDSYTGTESSGIKPQILNNEKEDIDNQINDFE
mmetsp:Transcript_31578/g.27974  ORF Transcript_31578/g.27974 Transcript_31578/m.27974 type:complete len:248 (+) Transcript_31578:314-1057(+)